MKEFCFTVAVAEQAVNVSVVTLPNAVFIWVGDSTTFDKLNVALCNQYSKTPSTVNLIGTDTNSMMSQKLCKRFGMQVMLSYNVHIDAADPNIVEDMILKSLIQQLHSNIS